MIKKIWIGYFETLSELEKFAADQHLTQAVSFARNSNGKWYLEYKEVITNEEHS